jgi:regulation of enolase protein 1 (concanavalin A-like superfamily)
MDFVQPGILELRTLPGHDLSSTNLSAPRLLRRISGNFAVETRLVDITEEKCQIGGLLLWESKEIYLSFGKRASDINELRLEICHPGQHEIIGRGWLPGNQLYLRLERNGKSVSVLCSNDGKKWQSCGETSFPVENPVWAGLYVACPAGFGLPTSVVRFKDFKLFQREVR